MHNIAQERIMATTFPFNRLEKLLHLHNGSLGIDQAILIRADVHKSDTCCA